VLAFDHVHESTHALRSAVRNEPRILADGLYGRGHELIINVISAILNGDAFSEGTNDHWVEGTDDEFSKNGLMVLR
jgi:hypothetical protein